LQLLSKGGAQEFPRLAGEVDEFGEGGGHGIILAVVGGNCKNL
jgi:hypothetical protein